MFTRRDFIGGFGAAGAASLLEGCGTRLPPERLSGGGLCWGALVHLGTNMWEDWTPDGVYPRSLEEERRFVADGKLKYKYKTHVYATRDYMSVDWPTWEGDIACVRKFGLNTVFIDIGESYAFPSHPELGVKGALDSGGMRTVIEKIRAQGLEVVPKLNFSTGHDQWLREYHWMTGTAKYRQVVADLIRDVCEVFDHPRYFHIGYDEESYVCVKARELVVLRQGNAWWKDFNACVEAVVRNGARPVMWSDKICHGREEFLLRAPRDVVMMTWYYGTDFSSDKTAWDSSFEEKPDWSIQRNLAASIHVLAEAGFDLMPCTSNWGSDEAADAMLGYCATAIDPKRILGYITAPWTKPVPADSRRFRDGIRLFDEARRKYFVF